MKEIFNISKEIFKIERRYIEYKGDAREEKNIFIMKKGIFIIIQRYIQQKTDIQNVKTKFCITRRYDDFNKREIFRIKMRYLEQK